MQDETNNPPRTFISSSEQVVPERDTADKWMSHIGEKAGKSGVDLEGIDPAFAKIVANTPEDLAQRSERHAINAIGQQIDQRRAENEVNNNNDSGIDNTDRNERDAEKGFMVTESQWREYTSAIKAAKNEPDVVALLLTIKPDAYQKLQKHIINSLDNSDSTKK